jgi:hypothetical protein
MRRLILFAALFGLLGSQWDGRPIVARTLESTLYSANDAMLVVEVVEGVVPEDLLGKTMFYQQPGTKEHAEARIFQARQSGLNIRIHISIRVGPAPSVGAGAIIL